MNDFIAEFKSTIENAAKRLSKISAEQSAVRPQSGKWSAKEILGHLIDSSINNTRRFVTAQFKDNLIFEGYDQDEWVQAQNYQDADWQFLIRLWQLNNEHIIQIVEAIPEEILRQNRKCHNLDKIAWQTVDKNTPANLDYLIRDYLGHMKHHLNQILDKKLWPKVARSAGSK